MDRQQPALFSLRHCSQQVMILVPLDMHLLSSTQERLFHGHGSNGSTCCQAAAKSNGSRLSFSEMGACRLFAITRD